MCGIRMFLVLVVAGFALFTEAQEQAFYFPNQQGQFVQSFQSPDNGYLQQQVSPFRQSSPGFTSQDFLETDLQTSDLPPHLQQTLPQYQFSRFAQPAVQNPVPFQLPSKSSSSDYLYDDDNSSRNNQQISNQQVPRPQPFQPAPKPSASTKPKEQHSHYLTQLGSHNHDPSQTETFLGQITLQSPDLAPDFNPDLPAFRPSKNFHYQHSSSLVDQFPQNDKWKKAPNVPVGVQKQSRQRVSNKPFRELSDVVDQHLEEFIDRENRNKNRSHRKPAAPHFDRPITNSVQSGVNVSQRFRPVPSSKSRASSYLISNNGDIVASTSRGGFRPKPTTTVAPSTTAERRNRFHPTTRAPSKPLAFHIKSNKVPFAPKRTTTTSTTENTFDLESLLEGPVEENGDHFSHDDDVEVIQSVLSTVPTTTEQEESTFTTLAESIGTDNTGSESTRTENAEGHDGTSTESKDVGTNSPDYSGEEVRTTSGPFEVKSTETETSIPDSTIHSWDNHEYYDEYTDSDEEKNSTEVPHLTTIFDEIKTTPGGYQTTNTDSEVRTDPGFRTEGTEGSPRHSEATKTDPGHKTEAEANFNGTSEEHSRDTETTKTQADSDGTSEEIYISKLESTTDSSLELQTDSGVKTTDINPDTETTSDLKATNAVPTQTSGAETTNAVSTESTVTNPVSSEGPLSTIPISNFDVLTMKPSSQTVENDNFNDFVDSTLIDSNTEEPEMSIPNSSPPATTERTVTAPPDTTVTTETISVATPAKEEEPVLIGEAVVSVVTTKSVINGTYSIPTSAPQVTQQMKQELGHDNSSENWMVVASVQTSRSVSGAKYLPHPAGEDKRAKLLNEQPDQSDVPEDYDYTESGEEDSISENPIKPSGNVKVSAVSSTESISDKLDRVQSELSNGFLSGGFRNAIAVITEQMPEKTTVTSTSTTTTTTTTTTTQKPTTTPTTPVPVVIRKFSANLRPTTTGRPHRKSHVFEKMDDLTGLLPPGFRPKYQGSKGTTTTHSSVDLDLPQGDEPAKTQNATVGRSSGISQKNKVTIQDDIHSFLPSGYKVPKESDLPKDPVKTLEDFLGKVRSEAARNNNRSKSKQEIPKPVDISHLLPAGYKPSTEKPKGISDLLAKAQPADISAFLPPGYKVTTEKPKDPSSILSKAEPVDVSAFLPPGFKPPKPEGPKNASNLLAKAEPVDISAFLPPGYKPPGSKSSSKPQNDTTGNSDKPKAPGDLFSDAVPDDIGALLPPGYKQRFAPRKPTTEATPEATSAKTVETTSTVASTTAGNFKVVFPSRPGGRKPIARITTPKPAGGEGPAATPPAIHKGWPSRATTEFTGWPTPSTTPISIEKLLEAARTASSLSSSSEVPTTSATTPSTTTTTTTTTPAPTTPGICTEECDLAGTIKLIGGAQWVPELLDHNTKEWQILANEVQTQLEKAYSKSAMLSKWYKNIRIDEFSPGSVLVDYTVELTDVARKVNTMELKTLFNEALNVAPAASARSIGKSENLRDGNKNVTKLALGSFVIDPQYTDFIVLSKNIVPTVGYAEDNVLLPQWAIAVIVIGLASLLFVIIFGVTVLVNRQKNAKKKQPIPLTEEMLNELNKNHMGGLDNYGADDLYNMEDVWNDKGYDTKPPKKRSSGSIHDNSMSNLYDSWRSEWNGYYYNAYYGNSAGGSNGGFARRRSDYDTNF